MGKLSLFLVCVLVLLSISGCLQRDEISETETVTEAEPEIDMEDLVQAAEIVPGRHRREADYMADFTTHSLCIELPSGQIRFSLHMADLIYEEAKLRAGAAALLGDLMALEKASGSAPKEVTVYLVVDSGSSFPVNVGTSVFCTWNDFEGGTYRDALCSAAYELKAAWQAAGLSALAFGSADAVDLAAYYADPDHALTATCSAIHLSPLISDPQTVGAARETARSLTSFLIQQEGFASFCQAVDPLEELPEWLQSKGIGIQLPEARPETTWMQVFPQSGCLAEIQLNNLSVLLQEDGCLRDPDDLYLWIQSFYAGMALMTEQIREEAPSAAARMEARLAESFQIKIANVSSISVTYPLKNEISLSNTGAVWHEMVHLLLEELIPNPDLAWECEAIAEHFSHMAETTFAPTRYIAEGLDAYVAFFAEVSGKDADDDDLVFHNEVWRLYRESADPGWSDRDDLAAFSYAYGVSSLLLDGKIERTQVRSKYDLSVSGKRAQKEGSKELDGNALSYPEAEVLFLYLASVYGTDAAVDAYLNGQSLEKAFGISYPALLTQAKEYYAAQTQILP